MKNLEHHNAETNLESTFVERARDETKKSILMRVGSAMHSAVDTTGQVAEGVSGTLHMAAKSGSRVVSNLAGIGGSIIGGAMNIFSEGRSSYREARGDTEDSK